MEGSTKKTKHSNVPEGGRRQLEVGRPGMRSLSETCKHRRNQPCKDPQEESPGGERAKCKGLEEGMVLVCSGCSGW